jgi:hypothetical protein
MITAGYATQTRYELATILLKINTGIVKSVTEQSRKVFS